MMMVKNLTLKNKKMTSLTVLSNLDDEELNDNIGVDQEEAMSAV